jgi:hypothetical protein
MIGIFTPAMFATSSVKVNVIQMGSLFRSHSIVRSLLLLQESLALRHRDASDGSKCPKHVHANFTWLWLL